MLEDNLVFYSALGSIHPSGPQQRPEHLSLAQFLATRVLKLGPQVLTVHDLVDIAANVLGGVHKGDPETAKATALVEFNKLVSVAGHSIAAAQLKPIVLVVLDGLQELEAAAGQRLGR